MFFSFFSFFHAVSFIVNYCVSRTVVLLGHIFQMILSEHDSPCNALIVVSLSISWVCVF